MPSLDLAGYGDAEAIARGGSSIVYRAEDLRHGRTVAIKVLTTIHQAEPERQIFARELRAMGRLGDHPNIVTVYDSGFTETGNPYLVMPFFPRGTYAMMIKRHGPLPGSDLATIGVKIAAALETAHQNGIIHRDIKPSNLFVGPFDNDPLLGDFGISSFVDGTDTTSARSSMTVAFAAPEVLDGEPSTPLSDIYSLGVSLYSFAEGRRPFRGTTPSAVIAEVLDRGSVPRIEADVPSGIVDLVAAMMAKDSIDRPQTALRVAEELQQLDSGAQATPIVIGQGALRSIADKTEADEAIDGADLDTGTVETIDDLDELDEGVDELDEGVDDESITVVPLGEEPVLATTDQGGQRRRVLLVLGAIVALAVAVFAVSVLAADDPPNTDEAEVSNSPSTSSDPQAPDLQQPNSDTPSPDVEVDSTDDGQPMTATASFSVAHDGQVNAAAWSPDGELLASAGDDRSVRLWNVADGTPAGRLDFTETARNVAWSPDGRMLAVSDDDRTYIFPVENGAVLDAPVLLEDTANAFALAWTPDGKRLLTGQSGRIGFWDATTGARIDQLNHNGEQTFTLAVSDDGNLLGAAVDDGDVRLFDLDTGAEPTILSGHSSARVDFVRWSPDEELVSGGADNSIRFWDVETGSASTVLIDSSSSSRFAWSPDGSHFVSTGGEDSTIRVWDLPSERVVGRLEGHQGRVTDLTWSPDGRRLASSSWDGTVIVWELA